MNINIKKSEKESEENEENEENDELDESFKNETLFGNGIIKLRQIILTTIKIVCIILLLSKYRVFS